MTNVLDELTEDALTPEHVTQRVDDWEQRIISLYNTIEAWLPANFSAKRGSVSVMNEELMKKFDVKPRKLPSLQISCHQSNIARLEPRALWIIGANGRLDFFVGAEHYMIMDESDNFAAPSWVYVAFAERQTRKALTEQTFRAMLPA